MISSRRRGVLCVRVCVGMRHTLVLLRVRVRVRARVCARPALRLIARHRCPPYARVPAVCVCGVRGASVRLCVCGRGRVAAVVRATPVGVPTACEGTVCMSGVGV